MNDPPDLKHWETWKRGDGSHVSKEIIKTEFLRLVILGPISKSEIT